MKFLIRGKLNFLEAELNGKITGRTVDPTTLVHFGTDLIDNDVFGNNLKEYVKEMEEMRVDYIFLSPHIESVEDGQTGKNLRAVTAYMIKQL